MACGRRAALDLGSYWSKTKTCESQGAVHVPDWHMVYLCLQTEVGHVPVSATAQLLHLLIRVDRHLVVVELVPFIVLLLHSRHVMSGVCRPPFVSQHYAQLIPTGCLSWMLRPPRCRMLVPMTLPRPAVSTALLATIWSRIRTGRASEGTTLASGFSRSPARWPSRRTERITDSGTAEAN